MAETKQGTGGKHTERAHRRRAAAASRGQVAANDDAPTIGGLIYAMEQKPSRRPFTGAAIATVIWFVLGSLFGWALLSAQIPAAGGLIDLLASPAALTVLATLFIPIAAFWAVATLIWRAQEMKLMSSAMTEVAVRLAEPDRMAEQSVASLGQSVRRQVSFMNDAVERALGRAGELEALVHNEVASLERSYADNETRIRGLINELSGERNALLNTSGRVSSTLQELGTEIPALIDKLSGQQIKLATIIEGAGKNLNALETAIDISTTNLETQLGTRTEALQGVLGSTTDKLQNVLNDYTGALDAVMSSRSEQMAITFAQYVDSLDGSIEQRTETLQTVFEEYAHALDTTLSNRAASIETVLGDRAKQIDGSLTVHTEQLDAALADRTLQIDATLSDRTLKIDATLAGHSQALDTQLLERTGALDDAFGQRLQLFDESIRRSTLAIEGAVGEKALVITDAMESQAQQLSDTLGRQANQIDETLMHGINAVRRTSESITKQSLKAIEGLANQSDILKNVSENMLQQIGGVTDRFEDQGQSIMKAANSLERANSRIDLTLQNRQNELTKALDQVSGKTDELDQFMLGYSKTLEGSLQEAEERAKTLTNEFAKNAEERSKAAIAQIEHLNKETGSETERALQELTGRFADTSRQVSDQMDRLSTDFKETSHEMRQQTAKAAAELESEQRNLREQLSDLPEATRESAKAMRGALHDQLKALEQLSSLSSRQIAGRDVSAPLPENGAAAVQQSAIASPAAAGTPAAAADTASKPDKAPGEPASSSEDDRAKALDSISAALSQQTRAHRDTASAPSTEAGAAAQHVPAEAVRTAPAASAQSAPAPSAAGPAPTPVQPEPSTAPATQSVQAQPAQAPPAQAQPAVAQPAQAPPAQAQPVAAPMDRAPAAPAALQAGSANDWSVGDLLARASTHDEQVLSPAPARSEGGGIDIGLIARALDAATAAAIWQRFREGQRGFMLRDIYTIEGRATFDEISRRYKGQVGFHDTVGRYLNEFEEAMRLAEQSSQDHASIQQTLTSDAGRVYLFLAHVSGRLS